MRTRVSKEEVHSKPSVAASEVEQAPNTSRSGAREKNALEEQGDLFAVKERILERLQAGCVQAMLRSGDVVRVGVGKEVIQLTPFFSVEIPGVQVQVTIGVDEDWSETVVRASVVAEQIQKVDFSLALERHRIHIQQAAGYAKEHGLVRKG